MNIKYWFSVCFVLLLCTEVFSQNLTLEKKKVEINRIDPPFWWAGMENPTLELMISGSGVGLGEVVSAQKGITVRNLPVEGNHDYLFVELTISPETKPGTINLRYFGEGDKLNIKYELRSREGFDNRIQGLDGGDLIYLLMPDRFANGDKKNDQIAGMKQEIHPGEKYQRLGGDIQGIIDHLDYLEELGVTTLWPNPLWAIDQPHESYHGYATTDNYAVDPRLGSLEDYQKLSDECHDRGMKIIQDMVYNHIGNEHYLFKRPPSKDWFNNWDEYTRTSYRAPTLMDPYASDYDKKVMTDGWFDKHMPDLNQRNPRVANYLIQNTIWWIEYMGLDGLRIDTYAYPDQEFMANLNKAVLKEYPQFHIFAETWVHGTPVQAFFTGDNGFDLALNSKLPGVTDFQLHYATNHALTNGFGWTEGVARLYYTLAKDFIYNDASRNVTFLDNHDISRYFSVVKEDMDLYRMGLTFLLTTRGIPCLYYGTEILMKNSWDGANHDKVRLPFPGGFSGDKENKFKASGRTQAENEAFDFVKTLANFRKNSSALSTGKLMQFVPEEGAYVYFRYDDNQTIMMVMNQNEEEKPLDMKRYQERTKGFSSYRDVIHGSNGALQEGLVVPGKSLQVWELRK